MATTDTTSKTTAGAKTAVASVPRTSEHRHALAFYQAELARFSTWLFPSVVVTMAFLLLGGFHNPKLLFLVFMYTTLGGFALSLLSYLIVNLIATKLLVVQSASKPSDKELAAKQVKSAARLIMQLKTFEIAQQIFFLIGFIALIGFAIEVSLLFFPASTPTAPTGSSSSGA